MSAVTILDNAVWHALNGPQRHVAEGEGPALRYHPDVSIFAGLPDGPTPDAWDALATLVRGGGPEATAVLFRDTVDPPAGWVEHRRFTGWQLVGGDAEAAPAPEQAEVQILGRDDVEDMADLVARTEPGPFKPRTIDLGRYLGIRDPEGRLIALAGERMRLDGYTEISAVCTDPDHRGRGLAGLLVRDLVHDITSHGQIPFLHAASANVNAIRLYESLGFTRRRELVGVVVQPTPVAPS